MFDLDIPAPEGARSLAAIGQALGAAGVGLEGGGMWSGRAHYLVEDGALALAVLEASGIDGVTVRAAVIADMEADVPGALGVMMNRLADAGVNLSAQYSDHGNRKVLVVDDPGKAQAALNGSAGP